MYVTLSKAARFTGRAHDYESSHRYHREFSFANGSSRPHYSEFKLHTKLSQLVTGNSNHTGASQTAQTTRVLHRQLKSREPTVVAALNTGTCRAGGAQPPAACSKPRRQSVRASSGPTASMITDPDDHRAPGLAGSRQSRNTGESRPRGPLTCAECPTVLTPEQAKPGATNVRS